MPRYKNVSLDTNTGNGYQVKAAPGQIIAFVFSNTNAAYRYVKLHDATVVTVGTTPPTITIAVPPNSSVAMSGQQLMELDTFTTGINIAGTTSGADGTGTAAGAGDLVVTLWYK